VTRLFSDPVEVHRRDDDPDQFLWRGRLYLVREVLDRWTHTGQWWRTAAVAALGSGEASLGPAPSESAAPVSWEDGEQLWWRVEADSGRQAALSAGRGVYDLCCDSGTGGWTLGRVLD
jgi:hypothetical protein